MTIRYDNAVSLGGVISGLGALASLATLLAAILGPLTAMQGDLAAIKQRLASVDASLLRSDGSLADAERRWSESANVLRGDIREMDRRYAAFLRLRVVVPSERD